MARKPDVIKDETPWSVQEQCSECGQVKSAHMDGVAFYWLLRGLMAEVDDPLRTPLLGEVSISHVMMARVRSMVLGDPESTGGA